MPSIYHWVPDQMVGTTLFPLNCLKESLPEVYAREVQKYEGREQLLAKRIPILDCLWNDVLFCSAVHPKVLKQAMQDAGRKMDFDWSFFEIDVTALDPQKLAVYLYKTDTALSDDEFTEFALSDFETYTRIPEATHAYYKRIIAQGKRPLSFHFIPHILYHGEIDTRSLKIVTV